MFTLNVKWLYIKQPFFIRYVDNIILLLLLLLIKLPFSICKLNTSFNVNKEHKISACKAPIFAAKLQWPSLWPSRLRLIYNGHFYICSLQ